MDIIITILITIIAYNTIAVAIYLISKENADVTAMFGMGIICLITNLFWAIYTAIMQKWKSKNFKSLLWNEETKQLYYCDTKDTEYFMNRHELSEHMSFARFILIKYNINDGWRKHDCHYDNIRKQWILSARYVPLKICIKENAKQLKRTIDK